MPPNIKISPAGVPAGNRAAANGIFPPRREVMEAFVPNSPLPVRLGIELVSLAGDTAVLRMPFDPANATVGEIVHGGAIATLIDTAGMAAAWSDEQLPDSLGSATVTLNVDYLCAAVGTGLTALATVSRRGGRLCFVAIEVTDDEERLIATGSMVHSYG